MGYIRYYTDLVEHYLRMAVRHNNGDVTPKKWYEFTKTWIDALSESDKIFILSVFNSRFSKTIDGLFYYGGGRRLNEHYRLLSRLERQFAIDSGLMTNITDKAQAAEKNAGII